YFVTHLSWRWAFYVNVPVGILALVVTSVVLKLPLTRREHRIDFLGSGVLVVGLTVALFVSVWGGSQYPWFSAQIAGLVALAVALFFLFVAVEQRAPEAVLPLRLFRNRVFTVSSLSGFIVGFAMYGAIFFVPLYLQIVNG